MKKTKIPNLVAVMVMTVVTILFWIVLSVVRIFQAKPAPDIPPEMLAPLNPNYDKTAVDKIEERLYFDKGQVFVTAPAATPEAATITGELNL